MESVMELLTKELTPSFQIENQQQQYYVNHVEKKYSI